MCKEDSVPKHSVRGYLNRQSTEKLQAILNEYLQEGTYKNYSDEILIILDILAERFKPDIASEEYIRMKEMLLCE